MANLCILGVNIDTRTRKDALARVGEFVQSGQHYVVTPNPEIILAAQKDKEFRDILNKADLAVPDGVGLVWAARFLGLGKLHRMTGVDLMLEICNISAEEGKSIFLLGAQPGVGEKAVEVLKKRFFSLKVAGVEWGGEVPQEVRPQRRSDLAELIQRAAPDILFVAFGHPKQEKWIAAHLSQLPSVKIAMGVGGAFDYIAGVASRAPRWMRVLGLEWLYRMLRQPWRIRRILNAVIVFPWKVILGNIKVQISKFKLMSNS